MDSPDDLPRSTPAERRQKRVAGASIAALVVFFLSWWVLGGHWPSFRSTEGWGSLIICAGLAGITLAVGLALQDPEEIEPDEEERGTV
ncbi:hypothetical protein [Kytococcus sp. Marseille-QA3725]